MYELKTMVSVSWVFSLISVDVCANNTFQVGSPECPCNPPNFAGSTYVRNDTLLVTTDQGLYARPLNYGSFCQAWDQSLPPGCDSESPSTSCNGVWCYVDRRNCKLPSRPTVYLPGLDLYYSYETCGNPDEFSLFKKGLEEDLRGKKLRWAFPASVSPWHYRLPSGEWDGIMWQWLRLLQQEAGFELEEHNVSEASLAQFSSKWDACINDIYLQLLDVCPTAAWQTVNRAEKAPFASPVIWSEFYLLVELETTSKDTISLFASFDPFEGLMYLALVGVVICTACTFWVLEGSPDGIAEGLIQTRVASIGASRPYDRPYEASGQSQTIPKISSMVVAGALDMLESREQLSLQEKNSLHKVRAVMDRVCRYLYHSTLGMLGVGFSMPSRTVPGRFLKVVMTFFSLVVVASYTANLAAFLLTEATEHDGIQSIEECVSKNLKVCVATQVFEPVRRIYPNLNIVEKPSSHSTMLGLPNGECSGALIPSHDYHARADFQRCGEGLVGDAVAGMAIATPMDPSILNAYSFHTIALHQQGIFEELHRRYKSTAIEACPKLEATSGKLGVKHFTGLLLMYAAAIVFVWILRIVGKRCRYCEISTSAIKEGGEKQRDLILKKTDDVADHIGKLDQNIENLLQRASRNYHEPNVSHCETKHGLETTSEFVVSASAHHLLQDLSDRLRNIEASMGAPVLLGRKHNLSM